VFKFEKGFNWENVHIWNMNEFRNLNYCRTWTNFEF
jgi:hypothetical protein